MKRKKELVTNQFSLFIPRSAFPSQSFLAILLIKDSMRKQKRSKTKQCLIALAECLEEQGRLWANFMIGVSHPLYKRTFMGGGAEAVRRRRVAEAERAYRKHLALLKYQQWIQIRHIGNEIQLALTPKGKTILLREQMKGAPLCTNNECTIVIFDIPERERLVRQQFRLLLKECGFTKLQQSVWMSQCDVIAPLRAFITHTKSDAWIRTFRARDIETASK